MAVCEDGGPGVFAVARRLLAYGWSRVGAAPLVVGRAGKSAELCVADEMDSELK